LPINDHDLVMGNGMLGINHGLDAGMLGVSPLI